MAPLSTAARTSAPRSRGQEPHGAFSVTERFRSSDLITSVVSTTQKTKPTKCWRSAEQDTGDTWWSGQRLRLSGRISVPPSLPCKAPAATESPAWAQPRPRGLRGTFVAPSIWKPTLQVRPQCHWCDCLLSQPVPFHPLLLASPHSNPACCFLQEAHLVAPGFPVLWGACWLDHPPTVPCPLSRSRGPHLDEPGTVLSPSAHHLAPPSAQP